MFNIDRIIKFLIIASGINLLLYCVLFFLKINPMQIVMTYLISFIMFLVGISNEVIIKEGLSVIITKGSYYGITQTFYEFLTVASLTIPLYFKNIKRMIWKIAAVFLIMVSYYVILYSCVFILVQKGIVENADSFLRFNTEVFIIFVFIVIWFFLNRSEIVKYLQNNKV